MKHSAVNKLSYLESLRGIAALIVVIDHSINMFAPHLRWVNMDGVPGDVRRYIAWSPFSLVYSGIPAVWIFFLLSGFVLSYKFLKKPTDLGPVVSGISKRYFRLTIPILGAAIAFCIMAFLGCKIISTDMCSVRYEKVLLEAIYTAPFTHKPMINAPLWTISWEIYGSFIIFALLSIIFIVRSKIAVPVIFLTAIYFTFGTNYILFVLGLIVCYSYVNGYLDVIFSSKFLIKKALLVIGFAVSLYLMSYPFPRDGVEIGVYHIVLPSSGEWYPDFIKYTMIGAILFFFCFMVSPLAQRIIDSSFARFLGYISFSMYILHFPMLYIIQKWTGLEWLPFLSFMPLLFAMTAVLFLISWLFAKYIDSFAITFSNSFGSSVNSWVTYILKKYKLHMSATR